MGLFLCAMGYIIIDKNSIDLSSITYVGSSGSSGSIGSINTKINSSSLSSGTESVLIDVETMDISQKKSTTPTTVNTETETDIENKNGMTNTNTTTNPNSSSNKIKEQQIENYRQGNGLMLNVHMTHHGG